ncbi:MAG: glycosyltransferase family 4 protein [Deltaproteobacteria bacterium]|nr:glycosyltransferase family 4 protein [Deltaproteobacteria bacterium]
MKVGVYSMHIVDAVGMNVYHRNLINALVHLYPTLELQVLTTARRAARNQDSLYKDFNIPFVRKFFHESMLGPLFRSLMRRVNGIALRKLAPQFDIIHATDPCHIPMGRIHNLVTTVHDIIPIQLGLKETKASRTRAFEKSFHFILKNSQLIFAPSYSVLNDIVEYAPSARDRIRVTFEAAGPEFKPTAPHEKIFSKYGIPREAPFFLYVGSLNPRKNVLGLIEAFSLLPADIRKRFRLLLISGPREKIQEMAKRYSVQNYVHSWVGVTDEELASLYSQAFALTYVSLVEGFGLPILEAMQCGCPVITSNCSSMAEVAGDAAILVDPHDVESIRDGMLQLIEKPDLRKSLIQRGFQRAKEFSWERTAQETYEGYQVVVSGRV